MIFVFDLIHLPLSHNYLPNLQTISNIFTLSQSLIPGMNSFLKQLNITFRRDPSNFRPRINKMDSVKDKEQKTAGNFFYLED